MSITCTACGASNPENSEFCEACGCEIHTPISAPILTVIPPQNSPILTPSPISTELPPPTYQNPISTELPSATYTDPQISSPVISSTSSTARLIAKQAGVPISEFNLESSNLIGRFDPDTGPVEIDLESFPGDDTISRHHAEIYYESGQWKVKDLGSTNGVFIKLVGDSRFGNRITIPTVLNNGDEISLGKIRFFFQSP